MSENPNRRTTEEVLSHHLYFCQKACLEETLEDYDEDSVIVNMGGAVKGLSAIKTFFKDSMETCLPGDSVYKTIYQHISGEIALCVWSAESSFYSVPFGTDTFIIRNGKIMQQTFSGILNKK